MKTVLPKINTLVDAALGVQDELTGEQPNPWLNARRRWNEVFGNLTSAINFLMKIAVLSWILTFVLAIALIMVALNPKFIPYIVEVNGQGTVLGAGVPSRKAPEEKYTTREISEWITNFRSVSRDPKVQRRWVDKTYAYLIEQSQAAKTVTEWFAKNDPFERGSKCIVTVEVESILQLSTQSWQIEWTETTSDTASETQPAKRYRALVTTRIFNIKNQEAIPKNPFAIFVESLSISPIGI